MAVGPLASWKHASVRDLWMRLRWVLAGAIIGAVAISLLMGHFSAMVAYGLALGLWVVLATALQLWQRMASAPQKTWIAKAGAQPASWYGMSLAHLGVAVFIFGVALVKGYEIERDLRMAPGDRVAIGGYDFTFRGTKEVRGPNYTAMQGHFDVRRAGSDKVERTMHPEKRIYHASGQTMTEADIDPGLFRDLYVSLGEPVEAGAWGVRVYHKPFIDWIWGGCFLMAIGGFVALSDRRYRARRASREATAAAAGARA
jgi:cytochrome c-type biogenesis protein CcmF